MTIAVYVVCGCVLVMSVALFFEVSNLYAQLDAPARKRKRVLRRLLRLVGTWQWVIAAFLVVLDVREGWSWWHIPNPIALGLTGLGMWLTAPVLTRYSPDDEPDLSDPADVIRWLGEKRPAEGSGPF